MKTLRPLLLALLGLLFGLKSVALAQGNAEVILFPPETEDFPTLTAHAMVYDAEGLPVRGLTADQVLLTEDGQPVALTTWEATRPGVRVVFAVNPGPPLGVRDALGVTRYEYVHLQWQSWIQSHVGSTLYDLSLTTGEGVYLRHSADFATLSQALAAYTPDFRQLEPSLAPLDTALQLMNDPAPRPAMSQAVLFLTPPLSESLRNALPRYIQQARQQHTRIFVWLVGSPDEAHGPSAEALSQLAQSTGGRLTFFSGTETLPVLEDLFAPLGYAYRFTYRSRIRQGEQHTLHLEVHSPQGGEPLGGEVTFYLPILPPNPALVDPPGQIVRTFSGKPEGSAFLLPRQQALTVAVDFPDGHPRPLTRLTLLVDGHPVAQRSEPPFDTLTWDLTPYTAGGQHSLNVEAEDSLGLVGRSVDLRVEIVVSRPPSPLTRVTRQYGDYLIWGAVALAGLLLLWVLLSPSPHRARLTEAAEPAHATWRNLSHWAQTIARRTARRQPRGQPLAVLLPLPPEDEEGQPTTVPTLRLYTQEALIGSDPAQAQIVLRDPSVAPAHARWWQDEQGQCFIADRETEAGTWVNYAPVSPFGARLEEGDIVHIGRVGFRFHRPGAPELAAVVEPLATGEPPAEQS